MIRVFAAIFLALSLSACGLVPIGGTGDLDTTTTGSITPAATATATPPPAAKPRTIVDALDPSDWETIRTLASAKVQGSTSGAKLDWNNPDTGSTGTLTPLAAATTDGEGRQCRAFALTVSDVRGIRGYRGAACQAPEGAWQLVDVTPDDRALL